MTASEKPPDAAAGDIRRRRLAEALRENLKRRKAQERARPDRAAKPTGRTKG